MTTRQLRQKYLDFFKNRDHVEIAPARLVLENDPTTLFTSAGMQPLIPYLLGTEHKAGKRLVNSQPCFRADDIGEVGDNRHTTFFEMLGNWSLNDYFKKEQLPWIFEFLTKEVGLNPEKLHITLFEGNDLVPKDMESFEIWKSLGVAEDHIYFYGAGKNWWSRFGAPEEMPAGEPGGEDCEVFYDFGTPHDPKFGTECHPNCDCGRFLEICNSVFIQYQKTEDGFLKELIQKNVDFGGGLERLTAASNDKPDVFEIDLNKEIILEIEISSGEKYADKEAQAPMRVIADHLRAATFLIVERVRPSNKLQGYILRRLLRRSVVKLHQLSSEAMPDVIFPKICEAILNRYDGLFGISKERDQSIVSEVVTEEAIRFQKSLEKGLYMYKQMGNSISGSAAFLLLQSFGFPIELTAELAKQDGKEVDREGFDLEFKKHQESSRAS